MKKIVFITGTRSDFGYIKSLINICIKSNLYEVFIFATGMHLSSKHGYTINDIYENKYKNVRAYLSYKDNATMDIALANTIQGFSKYVKEIEPDLICLMGDRTEMLAGAIVGALNNILTIHLQAGDTSGTIDDSMRHAISKMSHAHFCANETAKQRLLRMGENEYNIFVIGSPSIDNILNIDLELYEAVKKIYKIEFDKYGILIFHPVITEIEDIKKQIKNIVDIVIKSELNYIVINSNNDNGNDFIFDEYKRLENNERFRIFSSIKYEYFITLLSNAQFMIGNSSSAIIEAPYFSIPVVNIGTRQKGRYLTNNIFNCGYDKKDIEKNIEIVLKYDDKIAGAYGKGNSAELFLEILNSDNFWEIKKQKEYNI